jgi:hypothetical protein
MRPDTRSSEDVGSSAMISAGWQTAFQSIKPNTYEGTRMPATLDHSAATKSRIQARDKRLINCHQVDVNQLMPLKYHWAWEHYINGCANILESMAGSGAISISLYALLVVGGINTPLAIVDKRRERAGESEVMNVIGEVAGYTCILVDDIVDSGGTLVNAADALLAHGAKDVYAYITHGVLSGGATTRIASSKLKELVITDSIQPTEAVRSAANIRTLSIAPLIAEAISRTASEESVSSLFD